MRDRLRRDRKLQWQRSHHQEIERTVVVICRKKPVEREKTSQQRSKPKNCRTYAREQREIRADSERRHDDNDQEEQRTHQRAAAGANRESHVTGQKSGEGAHAGPNFSSRARSSPICPCAAATIIPPPAR